MSFAIGQSSNTNIGGSFEQRGLGIYTMAGSSEDNLVTGSTYLFSDWNTNAIVGTKDGKKYKISGLNYDAKHDKLVAKVGIDSLFSFNPASIAQASINNRTFKRYLDPELKRNSFYEVIVDKGNMELLKRINVAVKEGYINPLTKQQEIADSYTMKETYFINESNTVKKVPSKKKEFLKIFGDKALSVKGYIKENKLSTKKELDLKQIFTYYASL